MLEGYKKRNSRETWYKKTRSFWLLAFFIGVLGCESLLEVEPPDRISADDLENPASAELQTISTVASFECALAEYITTTGEVGDEFINTNLRSSQAFEFDARSVPADQENYALFDCGNFNAIYLPLSVALTQADETLGRLEGWSETDVSNITDLTATIRAYGGYARVLLGESFCTAAINLSAELTPEQIFGQAEEWFTKAMTLANQAGNDAIFNMALVGRARARRNLGNDSGALSDAKLVPEDFVIDAQYNTADNRTMNTIYRACGYSNFVSVDPRFRNLEYEGVADPRVQAEDSGMLGTGRQFEVWWQQKYTSLSSPIPIASWKEAQLIIAEIELGQSAVDIINTFHAENNIPLYDASGLSDQEILAHVIQERSRELFLEGHRFWDIRRFEVPFDPPVGAAYPKGGYYGDMRCFPLPNVERNNNPNIPS